MSTSAHGCPRGSGAGDAATPDLSVVIVSWNEWSRLQDCLRSIYRSPPPGRNFEILVVDNGSSDGTGERLRCEFPLVKLHRNSRNLGASKALNLGFAKADGEYILKLDADTELVEGCIDRLLEFLQSRPDVEMVAPRTFNTDGTIQETARAFPGPLSALFGRQSSLTRWFPNNLLSQRYLARQHLGASEPFEVDQLGGALMLFRRRVLTEVGFLDESYYHYWDDTDWCYRLRGAGKRLFCVPAARAFHHEGNARGNRKRPKRIWMFHYNAHRLYTRWQTLGYWDPRSALAGCALLARALLMIAYHMLPRASQAAVTASFGIASPSSSATGEPQMRQPKILATRRRESQRTPTLPTPAAPARPHRPRSSRRVHAVPVRRIVSSSGAAAEALYQAFEIVAVLFVFLVTLPIMLIEAVLIRLDSPGPALFFHIRPGRSVARRGRELAGRDDLIPPPGDYEPDRLYLVPSYFRLVKFRTMYNDSRQRFPHLYTYDFPPETFHRQFGTLRDDPRVTPIGRLLRKLSVDELPNLWCVLTGKMRLVGPRPEAVEVLQYYTPEEMYKFACKPGLTGLAQINGRGLLDWGQTLEWDMLYVRTRAVSLDLKIILTTLRYVVARRGAF
jgi:lipopolysaccharide/colanic/teichoic acid biosynthesis glycosyltransferase/GT2 family glycosyltransferase